MMAAAAETAVRNFVFSALGLSDVIDPECARVCLREGGRDSAAERQRGRESWGGGDARGRSKDK